MKISVIIPVGYVPPHFFFPPFAVLNNSSAEEADVACVVVEDETRWQLDEASFRSVLERRTPVAIVDPHDHWFFGREESDILTQDNFLASRWCECQPGNKLERMRRFVLECYNNGNKLIHFKIWQFDARKDSYPLPPCHQLQTPHIETFEEYSNRPVTLMMVANRCPPREAACKAIFDAGMVGAHLILHDGRRPYPRPHWLDMHRQAKLFLECGAGAQGSARPVELGTTALMLRQRDRVNWPAPFQWVNGESCIEFGKPLVPLTVDDVRSILPILADKEELYRMYVNGCNKTMEFSPNNIAGYVKGIITKEFFQ